MSDLDDLEGVADSFKFEIGKRYRISGKARAKARANANAILERGHHRSVFARARHSAKLRKVPVTLAPIGGSK